METKRWVYFSNGPVQVYAEQLRKIEKKNAIFSWSERAAKIHMKCENKMVLFHEISTVQR